MVEVWNGDAVPEKQVAAQALRARVSCSRWAMIISIISKGKLGILGVRERVSEWLRVRTSMSLSLERRQTALRRGLIPGIG